jgi:hypothetical protein
VIRPKVEFRGNSGKVLCPRIEKLPLRIHKIGEDTINMWVGRPAIRCPARSTSHVSLIRLLLLELLELLELLQLLLRVEANWHWGS